MVQYRVRTTTGRIGRLIGIIPGLPRVVANALAAAGEKAIQEEAPVRTGFLRSTVKGHAVGGAATFVISAPYAPYVIRGTRYMAANPFPERGLQKMNVGAVARAAIAQAMGG